MRKIVQNFKFFEFTVRKIPKIPKIHREKNENKYAKLLRPLKRSAAATFPHSEGNFGKEKENYLKKPRTERLLFPILPLILRQRRTIYGRYGPMPLLR